MNPSDSIPFSLLAPPYVELLPLGEEEEFPASPAVLRGVALVWAMSEGHQPHHMQRTAGRPGGLPLMVILPPSHRVKEFHDRVLQVLEEARPLAILPYHPRREPAELRQLLRRPPDDPAAEVLDYLRWRGLRLDQDTRRILRRTVELSAELRTLAALARGVYLSRRALGRRFRQRGLPVPSHWLQICRLLRVVFQLQGSRRPLSQIARSLGYPDGFTVSNQMERLVGVRPSVVRERLGWEWFMESWLRKEWEEGGLRFRLSGFGPREKESGEESAHVTASAGSRASTSALRVAEGRDSSEAERGGAAA